MVAGVYWKRTTTAGALVGAGAGVIAWICLKIFGPADYPHSLFGFFVSLIALVITSLITIKSGLDKTIYM
jgi:Na+/proline symporter